MRLRVSQVNPLEACVRGVSTRLLFSQQPLWGDFDFFLVHGCVCACVRLGRPTDGQKHIRTEGRGLYQGPGLGPDGGAAAAATEGEAAGGPWQPNSSPPVLFCLCLISRIS